MITTTKPMRMCAGCGLNLGKRCAVFDHPVVQWKHKMCVGFNNEAMLEEYNRKSQPSGARGRKQARAEKAKLAKTAPHLDGKRPLGGVK